jgi:hypothetical protein
MCKCTNSMLLQHNFLLELAKNDINYITWTLFNNLPQPVIIIADRNRFNIIIVKRYIRVYQMLVIRPMIYSKINYYFLSNNNFLMVLMLLTMCERKMFYDYVSGLMYKFHAKACYELPNDLLSRSIRHN